MAAVAFMFASTNLVIELGVLILIFLGWQFLAAEIVGGLLLIVISTLLIRLTYPREMDGAGAPQGRRCHRGGKRGLRLEKADSQRAGMASGGA